MYDPCCHPGPVILTDQNHHICNAFCFHVYSIYSNSKGEVEGESYEKGLRKIHGVKIVAAFIFVYKMIQFFHFWLHNYVTVESSKKQM